MNLTGVDYQSLTFNIYLTVDGKWGGWAGWYGCSVSCGGGKRSRTKPCTNPAPAYGGKTCRGIGREEQTCSTNNCPSKIDLFYSIVFAINTLIILLNVIPTIFVMNIPYGT